MTMIDVRMLRWFDHIERRDVSTITIIYYRIEEEIEGKVDVGVHNLTRLSMCLKANAKVPRINWWAWKQ